MLELASSILELVPDGGRHVVLAFLIPYFYSLIQNSFHISGVTDFVLYTDFLRVHSLFKKYLLVLYNGKGPRSLAS